MNTPMQMYPAIGEQAQELVKAFRAHAAGNKAFDETLWAIYGVDSAPGRIADKMMNGGLTTMYLYNDFLWLGTEVKHRLENGRGGVSDFELWRYDPLKPPERYWMISEDDAESRSKLIKPSPAAERMQANHLHRAGRGCARIPPTPEVTAALLAFTEECVSLWRRAEELFSWGAQPLRKGGSLQLKAQHYAKAATKERKGYEKLRDFLEAQRETA